MKLVQTLLLITSTAFLSGCIVIANPSYADHHVEKELVIDATSLTTFNIQAGAGSMIIPSLLSYFPLSEN